MYLYFDKTYGGFFETLEALISIYEAR